MNARAAWRLESLGFEQVYRYAPGKADWRAAGLPTDGTAVSTLRAHHAARRDVPVCRLDDTVDHARSLASGSDLGTCLIVNDLYVVLGRVRAERLTGMTRDVAGPVSALMEEGPTTTRADDDLASLAERLHRRNVNQIIVTDADGVLIGVVVRDEADALLARPRS